MEFVFYVLIPLAIIGVNRYFMAVDRQTRLEVEEARVQAALKIKNIHDEERRLQHERQLAELHAVSDKKLAQQSVVSSAPEGVEPVIEAESFALASQHSITSDITEAVPDDLIHADVFTSETHEEHF